MVRVSILKSPDELTGEDRLRRGKDRRYAQIAGRPVLSLDACAGVG